MADDESEWNYRCENVENEMIILVDATFFKSSIFSISFYIMYVYSTAALVKHRYFGVVLEYLKFVL